MGVKVRGIKEAKQRLNEIINDVQGRKAVRAIKSALLIIAPEAASMTPIDTSTLINSQYNDVFVNGTRITGKIGYSAKYAAYVHEMSGKLKGKPRAHFGVTRDGKQFGGGTQKGNYWDPNAEPQFLTKAGEKTKKQVIDVIKKEMSL